MDSDELLFENLISERDCKDIFNFFEKGKQRGRLINQVNTRGKTTYCEGEVYFIPLNHDEKEKYSADLAYESIGLHSLKMFEIAVTNLVAVKKDLTTYNFYDFACEQDFVEGVEYLVQKKVTGFEESILHAVESKAVKITKYYISLLGTQSYMNKLYQQIVDKVNEQ